MSNGADQQALWNAALSLASSSPAPFHKRALRAVSQIVPGDIISYNAMAVERQEAVTFADPAESVFEGGVEILGRYATENPLLVHYQTTRQVSAVKFSDFITRAQLHRTSLYQFLYRRVGIEHQLAVVLIHTPLTAIAINRARGDFSERERGLLDRLQPLLAAQLQREQRLQYLEDALASVGHASVVVDSASNIKEVSDTAVQVLEDAFGARALHANRLPEPLARWLRARLAATRARDDPTSLLRPFQMHTRAGQVTADLRLIGPFADQALVVLDLETEELDSATLSELGLRPREREILQLAARGWTAATIAEHLVISARTVDNHLALAYRRLGVSGRAQALRLCRDVQRTRRLATRIE